MSSREEVLGLFFASGLSEEFDNFGYVQSPASCEMSRELTHELRWVQKLVFGQEVISGINLPGTAKDTRYSDFSQPISSELVDSRPTTQLLTHLWETASGKHV